MKAQVQQIPEGRELQARNTNAQTQREKRAWRMTGSTQKWMTSKGQAGTSIFTTWLLLRRRWGQLAGSEERRDMIWHALKATTLRWDWQKLETSQKAVASISARAGDGLNLSGTRKVKNGPILELLWWDMDYTRKRGEKDNSKTFCLSN